MINRLFLLSIIGSTLICGAVYGLYFDDLSETSMVQLSYLWVFFLTMGIAGLSMKNHKRQIPIAILVGIIFTLLLILFYVEIWPML